MSFFNVNDLKVVNSSSFPEEHTNSTSDAAGNSFSALAPNGGPISTGVDASKDLYGRAVQWVKDTWDDVSLWIRSYLGLVKAAEINGFSLERLSRVSVSVLKMLPSEERAQVMSNVVKDAEKIGVLQQWGIKNPDAFKDLMLSMDASGTTPMHMAMSNAGRIKALSPFLKGLAEKKLDVIKELMLTKASEDLTPLHYAMAKLARIKALSPLLECLAKKDQNALQELMQAKNLNGFTPLDHAREVAGSLEVLSPLLLL